MWNFWATLGLLTAIVQIVGSEQPHSLGFSFYREWEGRGKTLEKRSGCRQGNGLLIQVNLCERELTGTTVRSCIKLSFALLSKVRDR